MSGKKIAIVIGSFNTEITDIIVDLTKKKTKELSEVEFVTYSVAGAIEIPYTAKILASSSHQYNAIVTLGAVIMGETSHFNYVCSQVSYGCQKVAIECSIPVIFGILTCKNWQQAVERLGGIKGNKVSEAIDTAMHMMHITQCIKAGVLP